MQDDLLKQLDAELNGPVIEEEEEIHVRVAKRNGRQYITSIEGLDKSLNIKKILSAMKNEFCCGGSINEENILILSGDQRQNVKTFLKREELGDKNITIHGF
jgi:translation initiation factor 1